MSFNEDFFNHIVTGEADDATPFLARVALNLGHDSKAYPVGLSEIRKIGHFERFPSTCGVNELFALEYIRNHLIGEGHRWSDGQADALKMIVEKIEEPPIRIRGLSIKAQLSFLGLREWDDSAGMGR